MKTSFVLTYTGEDSQQASSLAELRSRHAHWSIMPKLTRVYELVCDAELETLVAQLQRMTPAVWTVHAMTYAEISPPGLDLGGMRRRLEQLRAQHTKDEEGPTED